MKDPFHKFHNTENGVLELSVFDTGPDGHDVIVIDVKTTPGGPGQGYSNTHYQLAPEDARWLANTLGETLVKRYEKE